LEKWKNLQGVERKKTTLIDGHASQSGKKNKRNRKRAEEEKKKLTRAGIPRRMVKNEGPTRSHFPESTRSGAGKNPQEKEKRRRKRVRQGHRSSAGAKIEQLQGSWMNEKPAKGEDGKRRKGKT